MMHKNNLHCRNCLTPLTPPSSIISKGFRGRFGGAFLLSSIPSSASIVLSPPTSRPLATGMHTVRDAACGVCDTQIGWRYEHAARKSERYKIGKWILERERVVGMVPEDESGGMGWGRVEMVGENVEEEEDLRWGVMRGSIGRQGEEEFKQIMGKKDVNLDDTRALERLFRGM